MFSNDPRMNPNTANVVHHDTHQPYARRTISIIFGFVFALFVIGAFVGWYFFTPSSGEKEVQEQHLASEDNTALPQMPGNEYAEETGRSGVYDFFYSLFGGIDDGLDDNPHNLKNVEHIDQFNLDGTSSNIAPVLAIEKIAEENAQQAKAQQTRTEYRHSVSDVVGSEVYGSKGKKAGQIFDILVHKETGEARAIIVKEDDSRYERDVTALHFKRVMKQQSDGDVMMTVTEEKIETAPDFNYSSVEDTNYVSLRTLEDGQLLDFEDKVTGQIDAVIYENAEAQNVYFTLRPLLAQQGISKFQLPFEETNLIESPDGYDIKLTKDQTEKLAEMLFKAE